MADHPTSGWPGAPHAGSPDAGWLDAGWPHAGSPDASSPYADSSTVRASAANASEAGPREADLREADAPEADASDLPMPSLWAAAIAVLAMLAFGVLIGSALGPVRQGSAVRPTLLALTRAVPKTVKTPPTSEASTPPPTTEAVTPAATPTATPTTATTQEAATQKAPKGTNKAARPSGGKKEGTGAATPGATELPPVRHVFLIVLSDQGATAAFGPSSPAPYLAKTLAHEGELLENYYAVSGGELANAIALISGQGPTPQTAADCPLYSDVTPGTAGAEGQVLGSGCVYPRSTLTLADQLTDAGKTWKAYVEDIEAGGQGQATSCRHPSLGATDANNATTPEDAYVTWRNPFVYFHSLIDGTECAQDDVGLGQLAIDLKSARKTPSFAYIVPDRCHDGSEQPCAPGRPAGLTAAESFLRGVVPEIEASAAYKEGGLIAITSDEAPQTGSAADSSGCCITAQYPNLPSTTTATGTSVSTSATVSTTTASSTAPAGSTSEVGAAPSTTAPATPSATTTAGTQTATPAGGGRVGLLLISKYVKPGSLNVTGEYNHFALLRSIENLFGLQPLGYAGAKELLAFDSSVFNAYP
jgi:hypothetical protein